MNELFYISGPMRTIPDYNHPQFMAVEKALMNHLISNKAIFQEWEITNPARSFDGDVSRNPNDYMVVDLIEAARAKVIVLLPGWEHSEGAGREIEVGKWTGSKFWLAVLSGGVWEFVELDSYPVSKRSPRAGILDEAKGLITGDRNNAYGPPTHDFQRTADALSAYGYRQTQLPIRAPNCPTCGARALKAHDVAVNILAVKLSRLMWTPNKRDSWVDIAGYAGCGYECAITED